MTFGWSELLRGVDFLIAVIGLFGVGEILLTMEEGLAFTGKRARINLKVVLETWAQLPRYWLSLIRSSIIGCWLGITPGGATAASFMGYGTAKRFSKNPEKFGTGTLEGVLAPETAAHAAGTSALLPMLALGIPGSATAAVLLGGLMVWGLQPGPLLFVEQKEFVWGLIASMYLSNIAGLIIVLTTVPLFAAILRIPFSIIAPIIIAVCAIGAYTVHSAMLDVWFMVLFGVLGYVLKKLSIPARAARAFTRPGGPRRKRVPADHARLERQPLDLLVERPCRKHHRARADHAVLAAHHPRVAQPARAVDAPPGFGVRGRGLARGLVYLSKY